MVAPSSLLYWTSSSSTATTSTTTTTTSMDGSTEKSCFNGRGGEQQMRRTTTSTTTTTTRGSSRNKSGKVLAKKPPQRGLGVAQLERLRIQERWKKMTEFDAGTTTTTTTTQSQQLMKQFPYHQFPFQEQQNLVSSVPMIAAAGFAFQEQQICNLSPLTQPPPPPPNFVFNPYRSGGSSGVRSVFSDHHVQFQVGNGNHHLFESSTKELSSSQKSTHCLYDQCDVCLKKKRMINGENLGFEGGGGGGGGGGRSSAAAQYLETKSFVDGSDFLGLDLGRNWTTINGDGGNQIRRSSYSSEINDDQEEVEVVAIHRKGKISTGGGGEGGSSSTSVLMEYDFFPRKGAAAADASSRSSSSSTRSSSRSSVMIKKEAVSLFGDQGSVGESSSSATTNLLDLSLKLSC